MTTPQTKKKACCPVEEYHYKAAIFFSESLLSVSVDLTHWGRDKMDAISQPSFSTPYLEWKRLNSD